MADIQSTYQLWQQGMCVASTSGPSQSALNEILHYAWVYGQDGPVAIYKIEGRKRIEVMP